LDDIYTPSEEPGTEPATLASESEDTSESQESQPTSDEQGD
jgi:hypothetical protein